MSVSVFSVQFNVPRYLHFFQSFLCVLLIACCIVFFIYGQVSFFQNWSNLFHHFVYDVFVVADKCHKFHADVICILLVNYIVNHFVFFLFYAVIVVMKMFNGC